MGGGWITTTLILLPLGGAIGVFLAPLPRLATGGIAFLLALIEVGFWIEAVFKFDFSAGTLQLANRQSWFRDLGVSYHTGFYGFGLWLAGLTVVVMAARIGYAVRAGRSRP